MMLGNKTSVRLLSVLFEEPFHEFSEIELVTRAKTGKGSASTAINEMVNNQFLIQKRLGNAKLLSLNFRNKTVFLLKNLFDKNKLSLISNSKLISLILFTGKIKDKSAIVVLFGSTVAGTSTQKSDIDILLGIEDTIIIKNKIQDERKKIEELFGERFNLHSYTLDELKAKANSDAFIQNAILKGVLLHGYDIGLELFTSFKFPIFKETKNLERLLFFNERISSALRNYLNGDHNSAKEILKTTHEQIIFYLLSENGIGYSSKKDASDAIKKLPENIILRKISKSSLREGIKLSERFILTLLKERLII